MTVGSTLFKATSPLAALRQTAAGIGRPADGQRIPTRRVRRRNAQQLFQFVARTCRALRRFTAADEQLKLRVAFATTVFVKGYGLDSAKCFIFTGSSSAAKAVHASPLACRSP